MSIRIDQNAESAAEAAAPTPKRWAAVATGVGPVLLARLAPIGAVQFHVQSAAALLALLPLAAGMWGRTKTPGS